MPLPVFTAHRTRAHRVALGSVITAGFSHPPTLRLGGRPAAARKKHLKFETAHSGELRQQLVCAPPSPACAAAGTSAPPWGCWDILARPARQGSWHAGVTGAVWRGLQKRPKAGAIGCRSIPPWHAPQVRPTTTAGCGRLGRHPSRAPAALAALILPQLRLDQPDPDVPCPPPGSRCCCATRAGARRPRAGAANTWGHVGDT